MTTKTMAERPFVPAMGRPWLLPLYDPLVRVLGLEYTRQLLLREADLQPGHRVLDIGCGTGTLAILAKRTAPAAEIVALDPDEMALARGRHKARRAGVDVRFEAGRADGLPYPDASFHRVLSSFMFHHLPAGEKRTMLDEARRVLAPGGRLHLQDFVPKGQAARVLERLSEAGFSDARIGTEGTILGVLRIVSVVGTAPCRSGGEAFD